MEKVINHRLYLSGALTPFDRGIRCYSKCLGAFLKCFGFAREYNYGNRTYYVNRKSLAKYNYQAPGPIPLPSQRIQRFSEELPGMSLGKFQETLKDKTFLDLLIVYDDKARSLYLSLDQDKRVLLNEALIKNKSLVIGRNAHYWDKKEAIEAYKSCKNNKEMLLELCRQCNGKAFFPDILEAMSEADFREVVRAQISLKPEILSPLLAKDKAKAADFLYTCVSLNEFAPYYSLELKDMMVVRLRDAPENYFHGIRGDDEQAFDVIKEFLKSKSAKEIIAFSKSDPFDFKHGLHEGLFCKLITQLDEMSALHVVKGLFASDKIETRVKVAALSLIHKTFPMGEDSYPDKLSKFMKEILEHFCLSGTWETFLKEAIPITQGFKALIIAAVARGIMDDVYKPLLKTLLSHANILTMYDILTSKGPHLILDKGLKEEKKRELFALARSSSPILEEILLPDQIQELASRWSKCSFELQQDWLENLRKSCPKGYFHKIDGNDSTHMFIVRSLMGTMSTEELIAFSRSDPFGFKTSGFDTRVFYCVFTDLYPTSASEFISGLWGSELLDTGVKIQVLSAIHRNVNYSDKHYKAMSAVLTQIGEGWDDFLSTTIPKYEDGPSKPNHEAFFALLITAIRKGMYEKESRDLVTTLLKHEKLLLDYKILDNKGVHSTLSSELCSRELKKEFLELARFSSEALKDLLTAV